MYVLMLPHDWVVQEVKYIMYVQRNQEFLAMLQKRKKLEIIVEEEGRLKTDHLMDNVMAESLLGYSWKGVL